MSRDNQRNILKEMSPNREILQKTERLQYYLKILINPDSNKLKRQEAINEIRLTLHEITVDIMEN